MTVARRRALIVALIALLAAAVAALAWGGGSRPPERRPLLLLTSLPLLFGDDLALDRTGSPALAALEREFRVVAIPTSAKAELARGRLLLMAQPLAQRPEDLVALDDWVRGGGRVLLLADPLLEWPDSRSLGDLTRPPPMFMDTGLLGHWGLRLDTPEQRGRRPALLGGTAITTHSPGTLSGRCKVSADRIVARCAIGRGEAVVVADADLLNAGDDATLGAIVAELNRLDRM